MIGQPISRVDGPAKVTGKAKFAAEFNVPNLTYGVVVTSAITKGRIVGIDDREALAQPGVRMVMTHKNRPKLARLDLNYKDQDAPAGSPFRPLQDDKIFYSTQPIALVVADTFEMARYAATLVKVAYHEEAHETDLQANLSEAHNPAAGPVNIFKPLPPKPRGNAQQAYMEADKRVSGEFVHQAEHHNPMEMFATTAVYEAPKRGEKPRLTIYDKTQGAPNSQLVVANGLNLPFKNVRVISPFIGGAFGSGLRPQYQLLLASMAALELKQSVRVSLTRDQMFTMGFRPATVQKIALGAQADGTLSSVYHQAIAETSHREDYTETVVNWSGELYKCDNVALDYQLVSLDVYSPQDMRAPGGVTGVSVLEVAMDEMAYEVGMDPVEFRIKNFTSWDQTHDRPYSSKEILACYREGAERFGWARRTPEPRSMRDGNVLVGWGMASGVWMADQIPARAEAVLGVNGKLRVSSATADIGTGTYTIMTQIAAETLGLPIDDVLFRLGDTDMPLAPIQGGSWTAATVGNAVRVVCEDLGKKLLKLAAQMPDSPFKKAKFKDVQFADSHMRLVGDPSVAISLRDIVALNGGKAVRETSTSIPNMLKQSRYTRYTHSAIFAEVRVDPDLNVVTVSRLVGAVAAGRIINPKTARSQIIGGMVWGLSKALHEESVRDNNVGRFMNHNYAEYHIPVCKDTPDMDVIFVEEHDDVVNPMGIKGLGEIGQVGTPAAIANAIFHATGKRVHDLPITLDKLL